jgi:hypothetical protein
MGWLSVVIGLGTLITGVVLGIVKWETRAKLAIWLTIIGVGFTIAAMVLFLQK